MSEAQQQKILYIEDNRDNQRLVQRVLGARGYLVLIAEDGPSGVSMARESLPDLVLVDLAIPGLDGYETTTRLRSLAHLDAVPIIALTADGSFTSRERAMVVGCDGYLIKPIDTRQLPVQIAEFIAGRRDTISASTDEASVLRAYNQQLVERLEQRVRELSAANAELQELDQLKSQFLSTLSHELRTPLTSLLGYIELFDRGMLGKLSDSQNDAIKVMRRSGDTLAQQLNNLLYFQELRTRSFHLRAIRPQESLRQIIVNFQERAAETRLGFEARMGEVAPIQADPSGLEQMIRSLLDNAMKFTPQGGRVRLALHDEPSRLIIRVEDSGIGIAPEHQEKIFLPFYQVDSSLARSQPGSGLGLAIVRHVVHAHGGQVTVRSAPGKGSMFTVVLPRSSSR
ncbi:hybrid sensor histidine kinase/response regulator [Oscillochloris sp. ZM17-4]|uniref:sensor histidine kinase n=1 Tax=Oscillochloris sp. ZM17-4 TaxID=2866714 RepID=UPI001C72D551|nr:hybrid sensor histidine kinase/response regulator [Oscillochloris sp. ZM17-4]MBX0326086.1 hybrid sensor histidine kinase/response regulator [Oscillochloris sp. ZM17-4]